MAVPGEKEQNHQSVNQRARHRHVGPGTGVVNLVHGHAHLGVDGQARQLRDIKEKIHHHAQGKAHGQLQQDGPGKGQHARRRLQPPACHRVGECRQEQYEARPEGPGEILAAQQGIEHHKAAHSGGNQQKERQGAFVYHRRLR